MTRFRRSYWPSFSEDLTEVLIPGKELMPPDESGVFPLQFCFSADGTGKGSLSGSWRSVDGEILRLSVNWWSA